MGMLLSLKYNMAKRIKITESTRWDVVVIGGGASGMMAAGRAAELGSRVLLIEKNDTLGKKLLITGGSRCNLTNAELNTRKFLEKFKKSGKFLFSAFSQWDSKDTIDFFNSKGMATKIEDENRVFPASDNSQSVLNVLVKYLKSGRVTILANSPVADLITKENVIEAVILKNEEKIKAKSFILATGGKSRPETGSVGDGFIWLKNIGHTISAPNPMLVPVAVKENWVKSLQGVSIPDVKISIFQNNKKQLSKKGKILFTHFGLSGPTILNMAKDIGELLKYDEVIILLDILPRLNHKELDKKIQDIFKENSNRKIKSSLDDLSLPSAIVFAIIQLSKINPETFCHSITKEERAKLVKNIKEMSMRVLNLLSAEKAIVASGGIALNEINFKTMSSRLFQNLYLTGDILDIDRPSGGYSLQLCWTTGYIAGTSVAKMKDI